MALPDTAKNVLGTVKVFSNSGEYSPTAGQPSGTDADIDMQAATTGIHVQSAKLDLGSANLDVLYKMRAYIEFFSAPTAGGLVDFYLSWSNSGTAGTDNMGGASGTDAVYQGYGADTASGTEALAQLHYIGSLVATADAVLQKAEIGVFMPRDRYCSLIVSNQTSVTLAATDAIETCVAIWPMQHQIQD